MRVDCSPSRGYGGVCGFDSRQVTGRQFESCRFCWRERQGLAGSVREKALSCSIFFFFFFFPLSRENLVGGLGDGRFNSQASAILLPSSRLRRSWSLNAGDCAADPAQECWAGSGGDGVKGPRPRRPCPKLPWVLAFSARFC